MQAFGSGTISSDSAPQTPVRVRRSLCWADEAVSSSDGEPHDLPKLEVVPSLPSFSNEAVRNFGGAVDDLPKGPVVP